LAKEIAGQRSQALKTETAARRMHTAIEG